MSDILDSIDLLEMASTEEEFHELRLKIEPKVLKTHNASLLGLLAAIYRDRELWPDTERILRQAARDEPSNPNVYRGLALLYMNRDDILREDADEFAKAELEACVKLESRSRERSAITHTLLGNTYQYSGDSERARVEYEVALEIEPQYSEARYNLALLIRNTEESASEEVIGMLRQCVEEDAEYFDALRELGWQFIVVERLDEAEYYLSRAFGLNDEDPWLHLYLSQLKWKQNDLVAAERHLLRAVELEPTDASYHRFLGNFYRWHDRVEEANRELFSAIELDPNDSESTDKYRVFLEQLDRELAVRIYQAAKSTSLLPGSELLELDRLLGYQD